jgi:hypothetical protein
MPNTSIFNEEVGLLRRGAIESFDEGRGVIKVKLNTATAGSSNTAVEIPAPHALFYNNGLYIGTRPKPGTPIVVSQGSGGQYFFVSFLAENLPKVPSLKLDELLIQSNDNSFIKLDTKTNVSIGSENNRVHINTTENYISTNFYNQFDFTQGARRVDGLVKRDKILNTNFDDNLKLEDDSYNSKFFTIGLDPSTSPNSSVTGSSKNPPFVEQRELVYEFQYSSDIDNDLNESILYNGGGTNNRNYILPNRRKSRADTLSLTLVSPNYLMETIKGTVVDIFGNILDINRNPLPVGADQNTIRAEKSSDKSAAFLRIKEIERKSLAYHFEINARKDLSGQNGKITLPDINSNSDYARNRSRFFIDIDKEGQFKVNVPASSETGNVPLLTRYENYSTFGPEDNNNPNKLIFRDDNLDIFHDSFAAPKATAIDSGFSYSVDRGSIQLKDGSADGAPLDRITQAHIKHGTAYHDILQTCYAQQNNDFIDYQAGTSTHTTVDINSIAKLTDVVSSVINVSGDNANAGGRSGTINFDGSIEMNIGANTIDRQSLWLDTAGGLVANIGRDLKNRSAVVSMNGDLIIQIGGFGVVGDSRFIKSNNGSIGAILDLRVFTSGGFVHMIRCDNNGVTLMTPGNLAVHAKGNMKFSSDSNMEFDAETITMQGRMVNKIFGGSI